MNILVGYTGFVGGNLYVSGAFERGFNSKNIQEAYGLKPELLVYAGLRAEKYLANNFPEKDMELIRKAEENIAKIDPQRLVLISTVDVYRNPVGVDEDTQIDLDGLQAYGANRYRLEKWVRKHYPDALIIRLPALFGRNLKKNFIYDFLHQIPYMLKYDKFQEFSVQVPALKHFYERMDNGFYRCMKLNKTEEDYLKNIFQRLDFTALSFTDSRSVFQFYPLNRLWQDIQTALTVGLRLWNPATEPVTASEVYRYLTGMDFINLMSAQPLCYDYGTKYAEIFGGKGRYILSRVQVLDEIRKFVERERKGEE